MSSRVETLRSSRCFFSFLPRPVAPDDRCCHGQQERISQTRRRMKHCHPAVWSGNCRLQVPAVLKQSLIDQWKYETKNTRNIVYKIYYQQQTQRQYNFIYCRVFFITLWKHEKQCTSSKIVNTIFSINIEYNMFKFVMPTLITSDNYLWLYQHVNI